MILRLRLLRWWPSCHIVTTLDLHLLSLALHATQATLLALKNPYQSSQSALIPKSLVPVVMLGSSLYHCLWLRIWPPECLQGSRLLLRQCLFCMVRHLHSRHPRRSVRCRVLEMANQCWTPMQLYTGPRATRHDSIERAGAGRDFEKSTWIILVHKKLLLGLA